MLKKVLKKRTEMRKKDKTNLRKCPEGARKYVGLTSEKGLVFLGSSRGTS